MQPIIDIIYELAKNYIDAYFAEHPPSGGFVDRGDPAGFDWTTVNFTTDWTWRDLDCSAIVPENAAAILFYIQAKDDATPRDFQLREKGNVNIHNQSNLKTQVANLVFSCDFVCPCDENRFVQYRATNTAFDNIAVVIKGWWL